MAATTTLTSSTTTTKPLGLCAAYGDPHFITFDGAHTTFLGDSVLWLVKSASVWVQILSSGSSGRLVGVAVGGPFVAGHALVVRKVARDEPLNVTFDGVPILNRTTDELQVPGVLDAFRAVGWQDGLFDDAILSLRGASKMSSGSWPDRFLGAPPGGLFLFKLPQEVGVTLAGIDFISLVVSMSPQGDGQGGYCGNFNGDPDDDAEFISPAWSKPVGPDLQAVLDSQNLFLQGPALATQVEGDALDRLHAAHRPRSLPEVERALQDCPAELKKKAEEECVELLDARIRQDCIFDACVSGDLAPVEGTFAADILEQAVNARGVPMFVGHGECLDQAGRRYRAVPTAARTDAACTDLLRRLATTRGVLGAELRRGSVCQVLVEEGADPTSQLVPGGWGGAVEPRAPGGAGLISNATDDAAWNCWQLN